MVVFGIDPGYAIVGWGAISFQSNTYRAIGYGSVETEAHTDFNARLEYIYDELYSILSRCRPDALSIERLYFQTNQKTAIKVAQARGVTLLAAQKASGQDRGHGLRQGSEAAGNGNDAPIAEPFRNAKARRYRRRASDSDLPRAGGRL